MTSVIGRVSSWMDRRIINTALTASTSLSSFSLSNLQTHGFTPSPQIFTALMSLTSVSALSMLQTHMTAA